MHTPNLLSTEPGLAHKGESSHLVALAVIWIAPSQVTPLAMLLLVNAAKAALQRANLQASGFGGLFGSGFIVVSANVAERNPALREFQRLAQELVGLPCCEIAFYDRAEDIWRTIHPTPAAPFERFLSPSQFEAAAAQVASGEHEAKTVLAQILPAKPEQNSIPPERKS